MMPIRKGYRSSHLSSEKERAQFDRTAPILAPGYWDLADEVNRADSDPAKIRVLRREMAGHIGQNIVLADAVVMKDSRQTMEEVIRSEVRDF